MPGKKESLQEMMQDPVPVLKLILEVLKEISEKLNDK